MRKITSIVLSLIMIFTMASTVTVSADITVVPATDVRVNVAQGKTVTTNYSIASSSTGLAAYGKGERLTDGYCKNGDSSYIYWSMCPHDGTNINDTKTPGKPYFDIDLGRRYPIEEIVIFDYNAAGSNHRGKFKIIGSDYADFSQSEVLFNSYVNEADDKSMTVAGQSFPRGGKLSITLSEKPVYRYIRYAAEVEGRYDFTEFQVFSTFKATEVSRGASVTGASNYTPLKNSAGTITFSADKLTDGNLNNESAYILGKGSSVPGAVTIDLGTARHIGLIELYGNNYLGVSSVNNGAYTDGRFSITAKETSSSSEVTIEDFPYNRYECNEVTFPYPAPEVKSDGTNRDAYRGPWGFTLNPETAYQYVSYKKNTNASNGLIIQLNEFRAYEVNPEVYTPVLTSAREIKLPFSDFNMDETTINTDNIILYDGDGSVVTGYTVELADNGADVIITSPTDLSRQNFVKVTVNVKNSYGVAVAEDTEVRFPLAVNSVSSAVYELEDYIGYPGFITSGAGSANAYLKASGSDKNPAMEIEIDVADAGYYDIEALMHQKLEDIAGSKITMTLSDENGEIIAFDNTGTGKTAYGYAELDGLSVYRYSPDTVYLNKGTVTLNVDAELTSYGGEVYRFIMDYVKFTKADYVIEGIGDVEETTDDVNSAETKKASITIKTNGTAAKDIMVAIALYDVNGNILSATKQTKTVADEVVTFDPAATCEAEKAKTTKVFIWEANDLTPLR